MMVGILQQICHKEGILYVVANKKNLCDDIFLSEKEYYLYIRKLSINERAKFLSFSS